MTLRSEMRRIAKFSAIGTLAFCVDVVVFNVLRLELVGLGPLWAKLMSVTAATTVSWLGSRYWTFRDGRTHSPLKEVIGFFLVNTGGLLIALACLWISHYLLDLTSPLADNISGNVIGTLLGNIFRYYMYRQVIYTVTGTAPPPQREVIDLSSEAISEPHR